MGILFDTAKMSLKKFQLNGNRWEIVAASGKIPNNSRRFIIITVYVPPASKPSTWNDIASFLADSTLRIKSELRDPYIIISGDFNRQPLGDALVASLDIQVLDTPPTRSSVCLDLVAANF